MRSRQRHLCQPIQPHSPTPSKASPYSLLIKLNTRYTLKTERLVPAGIFDQESEAQKATFLRSVEAVNDDRTILTKSLVTTDINDYPNDDSFKASKKLCEMVQSEVAGIFGPTKYLLLIITDLLLLVKCVFNCHPAHSGQLLQAMCKPCRTH